MTQSDDVTSCCCADVKILNDKNDGEQSADRWVELFYITHAKLIYEHLIDSELYKI